MIGLGEEVSGGSAEVHGCSVGCRGAGAQGDVRRRTGCGPVTRRGAGSGGRLQPGTGAALSPLAGAPRSLDACVDAKSPVSLLLHVLTLRSRLQGAA